MNASRGLFVIILLLSCNYSFAQSTVAIHRFDSIYQANIYHSDNQVSSAGRYAKEMDSMLAVVYNDLYAKCDNTGKDKLNKEQADWIISRDKYFSDVSSETADQQAGDNTEQVIILSKQASYIRKRIGELLNRLTY
jgi:uncharacterized protein YecT (DUF1311 family)